MCLYPIVKFSCCDRQYKPTEDLPIVKFCPRGHPDTIRQSFPGCGVRQPHECNDFFRLPIKCPEHKLQWLNEMDLNEECQQMDREMRQAGVHERLRFRYRDKMGRAFEMVAKCAERMEAERLQAWKVKIFCTGAALELLGTAIVGSDAKALDYSVLEKLRQRLVNHINAEALRIKEDALQERIPDGELAAQPSAPMWTLNLSPPQSPQAAEHHRTGGARDASAALQQGCSPLSPEQPLDTPQLLFNRHIPQFRAAPPPQLPFQPHPAAQIFPIAPVSDHWLHFMHPRQPFEQSFFLQDSAMPHSLVTPQFPFPTPSHQHGEHQLGAIDQLPLQSPLARFSTLVPGDPSAALTSDGGVVPVDEDVSDTDVLASNGGLGGEPGLVRAGMEMGGTGE